MKSNKGHIQKSPYVKKLVIHISKKTCNVSAPEY